MIRGLAEDSDCSARWGRGEKFFLDAMSEGAFCYQRVRREAVEESDFGAMKDLFAR
jgi:hypothetical protein